MQDQFAISFHESFSLSRASITQIIENADKNGSLERKFLVHTALGTNYQKAMPRYALRAGLLDKGNQLTTFGRFAAQHDPALEKSATQWLLHYHLAAPHGPTAFWHYLVNKQFLAGNTFTPDDLVADLAEFLKEKAGKTPAPRSLRSTVTVFTGTYLKTDGLGRLGLLEETAKETYRVPATESPPLWALGYALADYWSAHYDGRLTVNLDDLTQGDFAAVFLLGEERLTQLLLHLKQEGMLDLYRISRPYQAVLLQPSPEYALQKMYAQ
jgi:hypothetical protein